MKTRFASIAALCILSLIACGEPEAELADDVTLVESETVITETAIEEPILREADGADGVVVESAPDTPVSSAPSTSDSSTTPAPSRPAAKTPAATTPAATTTPVTQAKAPARAEPTPEPVREPVREPEPQKAAPAPTPTPKEDPEPAASSKLPKTHTVDQGGVMHAPGSDDPNKRCVACHGKDLQGGRAGVSCFDCHEKSWE